MRASLSYVFPDFLFIFSRSITMNLNPLSCKRTMPSSQFLMVRMAFLSFAFRLSLAFLVFRGFISVLSTTLIKFSKAVLSVGDGGFLGLSDLSHGGVFSKCSTSISGLFCVRLVLLFWSFDCSIMCRHWSLLQSRESDPFRKLQEAEEDREIALTLLKKMEENLDLTANIEEMLHEKRDALVRGIKRLEEKTATVEIWPKKTKLPLTERMTKLEIYEEQSIRFNSIIRQINQKIATIGTSEIIRRGENPPSSAVKLPKMELKTFDGNMLKWHEFRENF